MRSYPAKITYLIKCGAEIECFEYFCCASIGLCVQMNYRASPLFNHDNQDNFPAKSERILVRTLLPVQVFVWFNPKVSLF